MDHVLVMVSHVMLNVRFPVPSIADVGPNVLCVVLCCAVLQCVLSVLSKNYCSVDRDRSRREQEVAQYILP